MWTVHVGIDRVYRVYRVPKLKGDCLYSDLHSRRCKLHSWMVMAGTRGRDRLLMRAYSRDVGPVEAGLLLGLLRCSTAQRAARCLCRSVTVHRRTQFPDRFDQTRWWYI
jgi:hypothetical protein